MRKIVFALAVLATSTLSAQSLSIVEMDTVMEVNSLQVADYGFHIKIENVSSADVDVYAARAFSNPTCAYDSSYFCWDYCYTSDVDTSIGSLTIGAGMSSNAFSGHVFSPVTGSSCSDSTRYVFYTTKGSNDTVSAWVTISAGPTMGTVELNVISSKVYPNPATNVVYVEVANPQSFVLYNALGMVVDQRTLVRGKNSIATHHLSNGVYLYALGNGEVKRLIVNH